MNTTTKPWTVGVRMSTKMHEQLGEQARIEQESVATIIRRACTAYLKAYAMLETEQERIKATQRFIVRKKAQQEGGK